MQINEELKNGVMACRLKGEININTSPELRKVFGKFIRSNIKQIIIDFSEVPYTDSSGLATLIELLQRLKKTGGELKLCGMSDKIKGIFEVTRLDKLFSIYNSCESALKGF